MLHCLIYVSSTDLMPQQADLDEILAVSRRNNDRDGITGMLLYHDGNFFQVLEGPEEAVLNRYAAIQKDARHESCMVLASSPIGHRSFAEWSMGYIPFGQLSATQQRGFFNIKALRNPDTLSDMTQNRTVEVLTRSFLNSFGGQFAA